MLRRMQQSLASPTHSSHPMPPVAKGVAASLIHTLARGAMRTRKPAVLLSSKPQSLLSPRAEKEGQGLSEIQQLVVLMAAPLHSQAAVLALQFSAVHRMAALSPCQAKRLAAMAEMGKLAVTAHLLA